MQSITGYTNLSGYTNNQKLGYIKEYISINYNEFLTWSERYTKGKNIDPYEFLNITILNFLNTSNSKKLDSRFNMCVLDKFKFYVLQSLYISSTSPRSLYNVVYKKNQKFDNYIDDFENLEFEDEDYQDIENEDQIRLDRINKINEILKDYELTDWANVKIFKEYYNNDMTLKELSTKYNLSKTMIHTMITKTKKYVKSNLS